MPEFIQAECTAPRLAEALAPLLAGGPARDAQVAALARIDGLMRLPGRRRAEPERRPHRPRRPARGLTPLTPLRGPGRSGWSPGSPPGTPSRRRTRAKKPSIARHQGDDRERIGLDGPLQGQDADAFPPGHTGRASRRCGSGRAGAGPSGSPSARSPAGCRERQDAEPAQAEGWRARCRGRAARRRAAAGGSGGAGRPGPRAVRADRRGRARCAKLGSRAPRLHPPGRRSATGSSGQGWRG